MSVKCPNCLSVRIGTNNYGKITDSGGPLGGILSYPDSKLLYRSDTWHRSNQCLGPAGHRL